MTTGQPFGVHAFDYGRRGALLGLRQELVQGTLFTLGDDLEDPRR